MTKYDLQDPYDLSRLDADFDSYSAECWEKYIELAGERGLSFADRSALRRARNNMHRRNFSAKQKLWAVNIAERLDEWEQDDALNKKAEELLAKDYELPVSHVTLRVAWHDNKWNGHICNDPKNNVYCSGFNSLLSERIRSRKEKNMASELKYAGQSLAEIDYLPPCFWSVNLFGNEPIKAKHDNPAAPNLVEIEEKLPARSMYSWPYAVSFTRSPKEKQDSGAYPKNLESVRIPRFTAKLHAGESIAFMYAKFSNPLTEEDGQYLVVGAGVINSRQAAKDIPHFGPDSEIQSIKARPQSKYKYRNFPSINWAMQLRFEDSTMVRMPYHEYLDHAESMDARYRDATLDKIKVAITEPELNWCFKYVAMDIGDDEAIYILTKMRKALKDCREDAIVPLAEMDERIEKVEQLLALAWGNRSYFPGFVALSRVLLNQQDEPNFPLEQFFRDFKLETEEPEERLRSMLENPKENTDSKPYAAAINNLTDKLDQFGFRVDDFLKLCLLNLSPFQFERILDGKLQLPLDKINDFDSDIKRSHTTESIIQNPYLLNEDYQYWSDSHHDVYGEEMDAPIDLFKIDIAYFPDPRFKQRIDLQREMGFRDKRRVRALVIRHLKALEGAGHCFANAKQIEEASKAYPLYYELGAEYNLPVDFFLTFDDEYINHLHEEPRKLQLVSENETRYFYLKEVFEAEKNIEGWIRSLLEREALDDGFDELNAYLDESSVKLTTALGDSFNEELFRSERKQLYENIYRKRFYILTGNAGSGKSHEILEFITNLQKQGENCLLLAPTGKAALRLCSEPDFQDIEASTIDKFLSQVRSKKITPQDIRSINNLIIDEASMVDLLKFERLLGVFQFDEPSFKRLILIGDPNQLPAIGYGRVLGDLIDFIKSHGGFGDHHIRLESNCRSELNENKVIDLANGFIEQSEGLDPEILSDIHGRKEEISSGFRVRYWSTRDELYKAITEEFNRLAEREGVEGTLNEKLNQLIGLSAEGNIKNDSLNVENFQIISPYHGHYSGASSINHLVQNEFKSDITIDNQKKVYKKSDKLIRTKNYYHNDKLVLSNGTLGVITGGGKGQFNMQSRNGVEAIDFDTIHSSAREFFELAYAITVHKSQGSGFNHLFFVLPTRYGLLNRELIYTALTRTKKSMVLFLQDSEKEGKTLLEIALDRPSSSSRRTSLMLDKPFRSYDLEPEPGVFVASRVELMIYHVLMTKRKELGKDAFNFDYEVKPIVDGESIPIKTDFTIYANGRVWYWEHLGLLGQRKYTKTWMELKTATYKEFRLWDKVITTEERNGISISKIEAIVELIANGQVHTEDEHNQYSNHHYHLR
jgi:exodeoxyribonuclease V alpha subunit